jgi:hypothetical protein
VPDEKKGERIVVIYTISEESLAPVLEKLAACDLPALEKPRANQFVHADAIPLLGTGKIDLRGVKALPAVFRSGMLNNCAIIASFRRGRLSHRRAINAPLFLAQSLHRLRGRGAARGNKARHQRERDHAPRGERQRERIGRPQAEEH